MTLPGAVSGEEDEVSAELKAEAAWRGFFIAAIGVGLGAVVGMITGFLVGSVADAVILATTGDDQWRYGFVLAETGTYIGVFLGIAAGIGTGTSNAVSTFRTTSEKGRSGAEADRL